MPQSSDVAAALASARGALAVTGASTSRANCTPLAELSRRRAPVRRTPCRRRRPACGASSHRPDLAGRRLRRVVRAQAVCPVRCGRACRTTRLARRPPPYRPARCASALEARSGVPTAARSRRSAQQPWPPRAGRIEALPAAAIEAHERALLASADRRPRPDPGRHGASHLARRGPVGRHRELQRSSATTAPRLRRTCPPSTASACATDGSARIRCWRLGVPGAVRATSASAVRCGTSTGCSMLCGNCSRGPSGLRRRDALRAVAGDAALPDWSATPMRAQARCDLRVA